MLTLWKKHSKTCKQVHQKEFKSLDLSQHRFFKKCQCACWVTGVHDETKQYLKQSLKVTSWEAGERAVAKLESSTPAAIEAQKITIEQALEKWLAKKLALGVSEATVDTMYSALATCVLAFSKAYGITLLSQLDDAACFELTESPTWTKWKLSTQARQLANLRAFFKYAVVRQWITRNPSLALDRPPSDSGKVVPFEPDEVDRLEAAFGNWTNTVHTAGGQWAVRPTTLHCLKHVLEDTGLRISDAQRVRPAIITVLPSGDGECTIEQTKLGGHFGGDDTEVTVYLKRSTLEEMARVPWVSQKYPFMLESKHGDSGPRFKQHLRSQGKTVYAAMQLIGKVANVEDCRPHRFRHTFAVKMLLNGWSLEQVSRFLGHKDIKTTQKFYAKWNKSRQHQLREQVMLKWELERAIPEVRLPRSPNGSPRSAEIDHARKVS